MAELTADSLFLMRFVVKGDMRGKLHISAYMDFVVREVMTKFAVLLFGRFIDRLSVTEGAVLMIGKGHESGIVIIYLVAKCTVQTENFILVFMAHGYSAGKTFINTPEITGSDDNEQYEYTHEDNWVSFSINGF
jgi:hypothetical protein